MRLVVQRVKMAEVFLPKDKMTVGKIDKGLFVLVGIGEGDTKEEAERLAKKLSKLRVMVDNKGKMNLSVRDVNAKLLVVSQFTLYADISYGNRPSFVKAAKPHLAEKIYQHFVNELKKLGVQVETGKFGEYMEIKAQLDGPVTILM